MDTRTGRLYDMLPNETKAQLAGRVGVVESDLIQLDKSPNAICRKCNGTGVRKAGMFSTRFKPCDCTFDHPKPHVKKLRGRKR